MKPRCRSTAFVSERIMHYPNTRGEPGGRNLSALPPGSSYVYALHVGTGDVRCRGVKVGITSNPIRRAKEHVNAGRYFGLDGMVIWVSNGPADVARKIEGKLKALDGRRGDEFVDLPFGDVIAEAELLLTAYADVPRWLDSASHSQSDWGRSLYAHPGTLYRQT